MSVSQIYDADEEQPVEMKMTLKKVRPPTEAALLVLWVQSDLIGFQICDDESEQGDCSLIVNASQLPLVVRNFGVNPLASLAH